MTPEVVCGLLLLFFGCLVASLSGGLGKVEKDRFRAAAASTLEGTYDSTAEIVRFTALDRPAMLREEQEGEGTATVVEVDLQGLSPGVLKIGRAGFTTALARFFGRRVITVGDSDFDSRFDVTSEPESLVLHVFSDEHRARIIRALQEAPVESVDLDRQRLRLNVGLSLSDEIGLVGLAHAAIALVGGILGKQASAQTFARSEFDPRCGRCLVCGSVLLHSVVVCATCRTPHHEDCWRLVRKCSLYGCKEARFVTHA